MIISILGFVLWLIIRLTAGFDSSADPRETDAAKGEKFGQVVAIVLWATVGPMMILWAVELGRGELHELPKLLLGLVVLFPWPTLRLVVLPLGLVRTAYYLSFLCVRRFGADRRGSALLVGAWALLRMPAGDGGDALPAARFIDQRLGQLKTPRGAAVVALAFGYARRGELELARMTLRCLKNLDPTVCPQWANLIAGEWLSVDAVARGDWADLKALTAPLGDHSPLTHFLQTCAQRFLPEVERQPPSDTTLVWRWLRAPHRRATWPLLERARNHQSRVPSDPPPKALPAPPPSEKVELRAAMQALVELLATPNGALTEDRLGQTCQLWDAALTNPDTHLQLAKRTLSLEHGSAETTLRELRAQVAATIGTRLRESGLPIVKLLGDGQSSLGTPSIGATAAQAVRAQLLEEIEQACDALHDRAVDKRALPILDEWREWVALRASYQRVFCLGGLAVRRLAWATLHTEACNWAVWLWNERHEKVLANSVFRFLLAEAEELSDESRINLARKNVGSGI